uniref:Uncharacterized protein n=1 Tax=Rhizophora mucronata TaxID=61149 RepID=A0A2P2NM96_RHIMU
MYSLIFAFSFSRVNFD